MLYLINLRIEMILKRHKTKLLRIMSEQRSHPERDIMEDEYDECLKTRKELEKMEMQISKGDKML